MIFLLKTATCLAITFAVSGCATQGKVVQSPVSHSLNWIVYVIRQTAPQGVRKVSANGREFLSNYFSPSAGFAEEAGTKRERAFARFLILGDRRPYRTEVSVHVEKKTESGYRESRFDDELAASLARKIKAELAKGREERNAIDDFRPF